MNKNANAIPWAAGGIGLAALENALVSDELSDPLKKINLGLGGATGIGMAMDPVNRWKYLASWPLKSMGLFGIGSADKFVGMQKELARTNLDTARVNRATAAAEADASGDKQRMALAFLLPALLGGGALAYHAYDKHLKRPKPARFKTQAEAGRLSGRQRIRIDVPMTAMPAEFMDSLMQADNHPRARTQLQTKTANTQVIKAASSLLSGLGGLVLESTGVPPIGRSMNETGKSLAHLESGDFSEAGRYGAAGIGNALLGVAGLRLGLAPLLSRMITKPRLAAWLGKLPAGGAANGLRKAGPANILSAGRQSESPALAKWLWHWTHGNRLSGASAKLRNDPAALAARRAAYGISDRVAPVGGKLKSTGAVDRLRNRRFRDQPGGVAYSPIRIGGNQLPPTMATKGLEVARGAGASVLNTANRGYLLARRNPNITAVAAGLPLSMLGLDMDTARAAAGKPVTLESNKVPTVAGYPLGPAVASFADVVSGNTQSPLTRQLQGAFRDPYAASR